MEAQTTLVSHESKSGTSAKGTWTRHIFTDSAGAKYQTFDSGLGNRAYSLLNQPVRLVYEIEQNGQYNNNKITSIEGAGGGMTSGFATTPAPTQAPVQTAPANSPDRAREIRIMRQSALDRAISAVAGGVVQVDGIGQLFQLSETFVKYFAGGPQAAQPGIQSALDRAISAVAGGDATAGAAAPPPPVATPPAAPVTAPQGPQDDIPF